MLARHFSCSNSEWWKDSLLNNLQLLHQDGSKLLDQVRPVASILKLNDDRLNDIIIDGLKVDWPRRIVALNRLARGTRRGRGCILKPDSLTLLALLLLGFGWMGAAFGVDSAVRALKLLGGAGGRLRFRVACI